MSKPTGDDEENLKSDNQSASKLDQEDTVENLDEPEDSELDAATMSAQEKKELEQKMLAVREELAEKAQPLKQNIQRRSNEEQNKLFSLIKQAIDSVAAKQGYDIVLNATATPFVKEQYDMSEQVLEQVSKVN